MPGTVTKIEYGEDGKRIKEGGNKKVARVRWQLNYQEPTGKFDDDGKEIKTRFRKLYKTKKEAQDQLYARVTAINEGRYLDKKKERRHTIGQLCDRYEKKFRNQTYMGTKKRFLRAFKDHWGEKTLLAAITPSEIDKYMSLVENTPTRGGKHTPGRKRSAAAYNRQIDCLQQLFKWAVVWDMVDRSPFEKLAKWRKRENNLKDNDNYLTTDQIKKLLDECADHLKPIVVVALHAGLRQSEVLGLKWKHIDFKKSRMMIEKPADNLTKPGGWVQMNPFLLRFMKGLRPKDKVPAPDDYIFVYNGGQRIQSVKTAFNAAVDRADLTTESGNRITFHTLRHTTASHMAMRGCTPQEIAAQLRHKDLKTTMRYMHLSPKHVQEAADKLSDLTETANLAKWRKMAKNKNRQGKLSSSRRSK